MSKELAIFKNGKWGIRTVTKNGETWFVAVDVAQCLEIANIRQNLTKLDKDETDVCIIYTSSKNGAKQRRSIAIVSEAGLYRLVFISRKPEAKQFLRWVTHEVLPAIRKHGYYANKDMVKYLKGEVQALQESVEAIEARCDALDTQNQYLLMQTGKHPQFHRVSEDEYIRNTFRKQAFGVLGILLTRICLTNQLPMMDIPHDKHGRVKTYPEQAFDILADFCITDRNYMRRYRKYGRRS